MEILIGKTAGFCYGVKRAVEGAKKDNDETEKTIYCLGEIVHNKQVVEELENKGIKFIENIEDAKGKTIIRAHGVPKEIYKIAENKNIEIIDYTCPNVLRIHKIAEEYSNNGYYIFLCGSKKHPEIIGTISHCGKNSSIIETEEDIEKVIEEYQKTNINKLLLIAQTTYSLKKFDDIKKIIEEKIPKTTELVIKNTICLATELRQKETQELSKKVDIMIIIGGKNSSNTKKLYEIAKQNCQNTIYVETKDDLKNIDKTAKIGIMAGASTPQKSIEEIVEFLNK